MLGQSSLTYCLSEMSRVNFPFLIQEVFVKFITFLDLLLCFSFKAMELILYVSLLYLQVHNQEQREYECDCGQKFDTYSKFEAHKKTHQRVTTMKCVTCRKVFTNETFYKRHRYVSRDRQSMLLVWL